MPRVRFHRKKLPILEQVVQRRVYEPQSKQVDAGAPALYNASRRIRFSKPAFLRPEQWQQLKADPSLLADGKEFFRTIEDPKERPSADVVQFIDDKRVTLLPEEKLRLIRNPARFFSYPENVPLTMRKLLYLYAAP